MIMWRSVAVAAAVVAATSIACVVPGFAHSGDARSGEQQRPQARQPVDLAKERQRRQAEYAEAAKALNGPAGNPECVWVGRRAVMLMWRDDLDTAFRHLELYDRFGCPKGHVRAVFRCMVQLGDIDPKAPESLHGRVHSCWVNPTHSSPAAASTEPAAPAKR
jgi:hypothetical protein